MPSLRATLPALTLLIAATEAAAQLPVNSCVLLPVTPGGLTSDGGGTILTSAVTGGVKATMSVTATGTRPTVRVAAPALGGPAASVGGATTSVSYRSTAGAAQPFTSAASAFVPTGLTDLVTFDARAVNPDGFRAGSYSVSLTVTCEL